MRFVSLSILNYESRNATLTVPGIVPFIGYHHILMILIAIAIILLCKHNPPLSLLSQLYGTDSKSLTQHQFSPVTSRLLIIVTLDTRYLPHIIILPAIPPTTRYRTSGLQRSQRYREHCRECTLRSTSRLLWHLHKS